MIWRILVDGSDKFLHLSCVMDDMISIVYAPAFYSSSITNAGSSRGDEWKEQKKGRVSRNSNYKCSSPPTGDQQNLSLVHF